MTIIYKINAQKHLSLVYHSCSLPPLLQVYVTVPFVVAYIAEAIIRIIGAGLLLHTKAYLRKPYHLLDVVVILVG